MVQNELSFRCRPAWCQILAVLSLMGFAAKGFQVNVPQSPPRQRTTNRGIALGSQPLFTNKENTISRLSSTSDDFVDVEFERNDGSNSTTVTKTKKSKKSKKSKKTTTKSTPSSETQADDLEGKSLFDVSLDSDPQWKEARIPFVDSKNERVIDGKLAFVVELEGVSYGIAVPFEYAAAIVVEDTDGSVQNMSPDDDENEELMEIMAAQLVEHVGEDLSLKRTPKVLTIEGDLGNYTKDWESKILPEPVSTEQLLDDSDEDLEFFHEFMKRELGQEEYDKTMAEPATQDSIPDEIMELFDIPGLGEREGDTAGMEEMFQSLLNEDDPTEAMKEALDAGSFEHDGVALKLISYNFKNGKSYSLVQLLKPVALVGKYIEEDGEIQFELLTPEEEKLVIPKLEEICQNDLEQAGISLEP